MTRKLRAFRLPDDLCLRADAIAAGRGETLTALLERALEREVRRLERNPRADLGYSQGHYPRRKQPS